MSRREKAVGVGGEAPAASRWLHAAPAPPLHGIVDSYLAYREVGGEAGLHRGLPSGSLTFIVSVGEPIHIVHSPTGGAIDETHRATVGGLHTSAALIQHDGDQCGVAIDLRVDAARSLLGVPAAALADCSLELADVVGPAGDELWERLQAAESVAAQIALCDDVLVRLADRAPAGRIAPELREAWRLLEASSGSVRIADVAATVGWSRQHLRRRFRAEYGIGPKAAARVLRFGRSVAALKSGRGSSLATLAAECGYTDQAHLTNEWKALAGCTPSEWLATERVPFVQDADLTVV